MHPPDFPVVPQRSPKDIAYPEGQNPKKEAERSLASDLPDFEPICSRVRESVRNDVRWKTGNKAIGDDIVVSTLGTGSAMPSKHRNVASIHVDVPGMGGILLDAGEGSLGQLRRRFGLIGLKKVYENLRMVFISHMHADHHLGLQRILEDRLKVRVIINKYSF